MPRRGDSLSVFLSCIILVAAVLLLNGCSSDPETANAPVIYSVVPDTAGIGDTLLISGAELYDNPSDIVVAFSASNFNSLHSYREAVPFDMSRTAISVKVPDGTFTGKLRIHRSSPLASSNPFGIEVPPLPSNELDISVFQNPGDVAKLFYSSSTYDLLLGEEDSPSEYLLVLFNSAAPLYPYSEYDYSVLSGPPCILEVTRSLLDGDGPVDHAIEGDVDRGATRGLDMPVKIDFSGSFDGRKRREFREAISGRRRQGESPDLRTAAAAPETRTFDVYSDFSGSTIDPGSFTEITADLKYEGEHVLLYVDQSTHHTCISDFEAEALGEQFDTSIYQTDRAAFGSESDINADGKVAILMSPVINLLTLPGAASTEGYIAGFFLPGDLIPDYVDPYCTNAMEIFYAIVPDPGGLYGNTYEKERALEVIRGVLAHEFLHMIMFNYRILIYGEGMLATYAAETWVDEGLAHIAEDLNDHDESNIGRADLFLADPGAVTLIHGGDGLSERGAAFLFFRYLGDRFGESIFREIVQARATGTKNIEKATGLDFLEIFADWAVTLYVEGRGVTSDDRFSYSSIDLRNDFTELGFSQFDYCHIPVLGNVRSMGPEFILMSFEQGTGLQVDIESDASSMMNAVLVRLQ